MLIQGLAPLFWTPLGDCFGRRLILIAKLVIFVAANAGLLGSHIFASLMVVRAIQAFGSAHLSVIGNYFSAVFRFLLC